MLSRLIRDAKRTTRAITRAATGLASRIAQLLHRAWRYHGARVATDATYAAVTATVLAGFLGLVPVKDALSAVLAGVLGVYMTSRHHSRDVNRWNGEDWDLS